MNAELDGAVPAKDLVELASRGIRGELLFAVPSVLRANPRLLGYYRLLLGFSQKEFYNKSRLARFGVLEFEGKVTLRLESELPDLCRALAVRASEMAARIGYEKITRELLHELTLLTLGPQLRGSNNTRIGKQANKAVFNIIRQLVHHAAENETEDVIVLRNASHRRVRIMFAADPDISITEDISARSVNRVVAIEIKGGTDKSNIWNRLGEAETSHQSAKHRGFVEFWTIYNVSSLDLTKAREKSPTTTRFYSLLDLQEAGSEASHDFRDRLVSLVGIRAGHSQKRKRRRRLS